MIKVIFKPGIRVMQMLTTRQKMPLVSLLFMVPLGVLYYETYPQLPTATTWIIAGTLALALYGVVSFFLQADSGWLTLIGNLPTGAR